MEKNNFSGLFWNIAPGSRYIAAMGRGVTVWKRETFELVHHFTGIRSIHGGFFLNEDILAVFTGNQRLYFLKISEKKILWTCPKPRELAASGDMQCCQIPGTDKAACIAQGRRNLNEHFLLLVDYKNRTFSVTEIPGSYRVVKPFVWTKQLGLTFLSTESDGNGMFFYKITSVNEMGAVSTVCEWKSRQWIEAYSGNYLFIEDDRDQEKRLWMQKIDISQKSQQWRGKAAKPLALPTFRQTQGWVGERREYLPSISWADEDAGLLIANTMEWVGVYDFFRDKLIAEHNGKSVYCGIVLDGNLLVGGAEGLVLEHLDNT